jgi:hypothetical protein
MGNRLLFSTIDLEAIMKHIYVPPSAIIGIVYSF